ncbi:MAG: VanZ family protein [Lachnospiraceae bacterium]|nr:VanZ family protein [Lachnospiraceae bacterium]
MRVADLIQLGMEYLVYALILAVICGGLFGVGYFIIYKKIMKGQKKLSLPKFLLYAMFICYIFMVFGVTLLSRFAYQTELFRLMPLYSYIEAWHQYKDASWRNIILNIFMLVPFGLLLPYIHKIFKKFGPTALAGFTFTLLIEVVQLVLRRGIFEADDLINNTLGTLIGYGLYRLADYIHKRIKKEPISIKPVLLYQLPLVITAVAFTAIFSLHHFQELGNLKCHHIINAHPASVTCNTSFDTSPKTASVYIVPVSTIDETEHYAREFFASLGYGLDESRTDIYDDTAFYYSDPGDIILSIDYEGNKIDYNNFAYRWDENDEMIPANTTATEKEIRTAVKDIGFFIPEGAEFTNLENGTYRFLANCILYEDFVYDGQVNVTYNSLGKIENLDYNIIKCTAYKDFPIITEEEAYQRIADGIFLYEPAFEPEHIVVNDIFLAYEVDSKGFYQPIYIFECNIDDLDTRLYTPAIK